MGLDQVDQRQHDEFGLGPRNQHVACDVELE